MQAGERDLGRAGQVEVVGLERVDVRALGREEAGAVHRLLAHEHRRQHRHVAVRDGAVEREAVEREREQRRVADQVAEARAGEPRARAPSRSGRPRCARGRRASGRRRGAAPRRPRRCRRRAPTGRAGSAPDVEQRVALGLGGGELLLGRAQLLLHAVQLLELLRASACPSASAGRAARRPAGRARASARRRRAARRTRSAAPLRASAARKRVGVGACCAEVDHRAESKVPARRLEHLRDALLGRGRADPVGHRLHPLVRVLDRDAVAGPLDQLDVVLAVAERDRLLAREAEMLGRGSRGPSPSSRPRVANSRKYGSDFVMCIRAAEALAHPHAEPVELDRVADADELRRRLGQPRARGRRPRGRSRCWKSAYASASGVIARDVELVADVDVRLVALGLDRRDRLRASSSSIGTCRSQRPVGVGDDRALVADDRIVEARPARARGAATAPSGR